ncbi:hypothetical protein [Mycobacterium tilburgii]|uniref:hypothetical protein n=1 Tax=Mycobacterium tilburgii TaxID=44467 RepID=UPI001182EC90|nr:hypothetical protein [Mycobacterium tilburgii]
MFFHLDDPAVSTLHQQMRALLESAGFAPQVVQDRVDGVSNGFDFVECIASKIKTTSSHRSVSDSRRRNRSRMVFCPFDTLFGEIVNDSG